MTNKIIIIGIIIFLAATVIFFGLEVKNLRAEVTRLAQTPAVSMNTNQQQTQPKFTKRDAWSPTFQNQWNTYDELAQIQKQMNQLFNETFQGGLWQRGRPAANVYALSTDIKDTKDKYIINMDMPGMEKDKINVDVKNNTLFISGERNNEAEANNSNYYKQERSFGYFSQSLPLPEDVDSANITVNYDKGVLNVEIPKLTKADVPAQSSKIKVN